MLSALLERIFQGVDDAASASTLKAHIDMLKTAAELLEKENNELKHQNSILLQKVQELESIAKEFAMSNQFVDLGIIKIKLGPDGNRLASLYCPQCGGMIVNPEHFSEDQKRFSQYSPHVGCMKKCGYHVRIDSILQVLREWDQKNQPR